MLLKDLNTKVLLDVFSYLDLFDSINLAETCVRLREVAEMKYQQQYKTFDLWRYCLNLNKLKDTSSMMDIEKVLSHIGPHISVLYTNLIQFENNVHLSKAIQKYCVKVKSLKILRYEPVYSRWIQNLRLERLSLHCKDVLMNKVCNGITTLKELKVSFFYDFDGDRDNNKLAFEFHNVLEGNPNVEVLDIPLYEQFNYEIFSNLNNLQCLGVNVKDARYLAKLIPYLNMDKLTKFKIGDWDHLHRYTDELNQFLKIIATKAKLKVLSIVMCKRSIIESTLDTLKVFNLKALYVTAPSDQNQRIEKVLVQVQPNLILLNLGLRDQTLDRTIFLIINLKKLELLDVIMNDAVINQLLNQDTIKMILQSSDKRPALQLHIRCLERQHEVIIIKFDFNLCEHQIIKRSNLNDFFDKMIPPCCHGDI